jgi:acyl carrier protein
MFKFLQKDVCRVLNLDESHIPPPDKGFMDMGMDSLMAVDLKNSLEQSLGCRLPSTLIFEQPNIDVLANYMLDDILGYSGSEGQAQVSLSEKEEEIPAVADLDKDELEASITQEIKELEDLL